jgi:hypothetical protein
MGWGMKWGGAAAVRRESLGRRCWVCAGGMVLPFGIPFWDPKFKIGVAWDTVKGFRGKMAVAREKTDCDYGPDGKTSKGSTE